MRHAAGALTFVLGLLALSPCGRAAPATQSVLAGFWDRDDGLGGVRIAPCGDALCGDVVWLKDPKGPAHVGERLLYGLHKNAEATWIGSAVDPEDRGTYAGTVLLDGNHVTMRGCAVFGLVCRSVGLTRVGSRVR